MAALTGAPLRSPRSGRIAAKTRRATRCAITLEAPQACPRYCGRVVRGVNARAPTPRLDGRAPRAQRPALDQRCRRHHQLRDARARPAAARVRPGKLEGGIACATRASGETLKLLNGETRRGRRATYLRHRRRRRSRRARRHHGRRSRRLSAMTTTDIFLESAFFSSRRDRRQVARARLLYRSSHTASSAASISTTTLRALERATRAGPRDLRRRAGPGRRSACDAARAQAGASAPSTRAQRVLGMAVASMRRCAGMFARLGFDIRTSADDAYGHAAELPLRHRDRGRPDRGVARIYGYDSIPAAPPVARLTMLPAPRARRTRAAAARARWPLRDYSEVVNFSFVDRRGKRTSAGNAIPSRWPIRSPAR